MKTTLSDSQIEQANDLVTRQLIQEIDSDHWIVNSASSSGSYEVESADQSVHAYDLYCKCKGWQFKKGMKDCKHCEAVRIYQGINQNTKGSDYYSNENKSDYHYAKKKEIQAWIRKTKAEILKEEGKKKD